MFDKIIEFTLQWEGGDKVTHDKDDPGGTTKYGISQRAHPDVDVENLTLEQAKEIYRKNYWEKVARGVYPALDCCAFDTAVNVGVSRTLKWLSVYSTWHELLQRRKQYYNSLALQKNSMKKYLKGWLNRCDALEIFLSQV